MATTIAMSGCATPYIAPTGGLTAKLIVPVATEKWKPNEFHFVKITPNNDEGCGELSGSILPDTFVKDMTLTIAADRDILFSIQRVWNPAFCANIFGRFHAIKDYEYTLNLDIVGNKCVVSVIGKSPIGTSTPINITRAYKSSIGGARLCDTKDKITDPAR